MSAIILNGTTYNGAGGNPYPPDADGGIDLTPRKIGRLLIAANGARSFVNRGAGIVKREWKLTWTNAGTVTYGAVRTLVALTTTFTFTDEFGAPYTVQIEEEDLTAASAFVKYDNTMLYTFSLTVRET